MALAKYFEDIIDRWVEDNRDRFADDLSLGHTWYSYKQAIRTNSAAVIAIHNGRPFEDLMVFLKGEKIVFQVESANPSIQCGVDYVPAGKPVRKIQSPKTNQHTIPTEEGEGILRITAGNYVKQYRIKILDKIRPETIPAIREALNLVTGNPATWDQFTFEKIRNQVAILLKQAGVPEEFGRGIMEFYLGLFHETLGEPNYRKRLEAAFVLLRPFTPYSDYAALVCAYYLFRINTFGPVAAMQQFPLLSSVSAFFNSPFQQAKQITETKNLSSHSKPFEILVSQRDFHVLKAARHFLNGDIDSAEELLEAPEAKISASPDPQGDERYYILQARVLLCRNDKKKAQRSYSYLRTSSCPVFQQEAVEFLK